MPLLIILLPVILIALWAVSEYNFFVSSKARIKAAVQEIGNQLKRQVELIPNLEASAKGFLKHEKDIFKQLTDARRAVASAVDSGDLQKMSEAGAKVAAVLPALKIAVEDNPEIKGSEVVTKLMDELRDTSDKVMYARRLVIDLTADYNVKLVSFPSSILANMFGFTEQEGLITPQKGEHLEVRDSDMKSPRVKLD
ncbi:MAG: LemA family protein [Candidatus Woesebacteria bacterium GW2011_GWB1_38_5b]|uniref:LemA family protein n=1 Tax=Candidatus Woesebacteria bacterium GW2011_GWB1_38_5b TaxID=1618569 RepID=A0A0G0NFP8_9BACT|nr:MAG: LemA family protein [Candidatus Woesebacteria bacterium GW2011_GWB1_38_5b]KKQ76851.1 MAG: LemA family protein [Parcubacteria group bacterium GW2011_GWA1_38_7]